MNRHRFASYPAILACCLAFSYNLHAGIIAITGAFEVVNAPPSVRRQVKVGTDLDQIRVITAVPEPGTSLLLTALVPALFIRRHQSTTEKCVGRIDQVP